MSSIALRQWAPRGARAALTPALAVTCRGLTTTSKLRPSSALARGTSPASQSDPSALQIRSFHRTPIRGFSDSLIAAALGLGTGLLVTKFFGRMTARVGTWAHVPPLSWLQKSPKKTRDVVLHTISAGIDLAEQMPPGPKRDEAFRELSFQIPYHLAELDPDALEFKLEDMGNPSLTNDDWRLSGKEWDAKDPSEPADPSPFEERAMFPVDERQDVRIYFYFPDGADEAQAVFMAVNADFGLRGPDEKPVDPPVDMIKVVSSFHHLLQVWARQARKWQRDRPDIFERMKEGDLPLVVNVRHQCCGTIFNTSSMNYPFPQSLNSISSLHMVDRHFAAEGEGNGQAP